MENDMADTIEDLTVSDPYILNCGILNYAFPNPKFVVTDNYKELKRKIETIDNSTSEPRAVRIGGPKGVGKSFALVLLWYQLNGDRPCILITAKSFGSPFWFTHLMELCRRFGGKLFIRYNCYAYSSNKSNPNPNTHAGEGVHHLESVSSVDCALLQRVVRSLSNALVLVDLSEVVIKPNMHMYSDLLELCFSNQITTVISMSSGSGLYSLSRASRKFFSTLYVQVPVVKFKPFSDVEANAFIDHIGCFRGKITDPLEVKALTGYNPFLLSILSRQNRSEWQNCVDVFVRNYVCELLDDFTDRRFATLVESDLSYNTELLFYAMNRTPVPSSSTKAYENSWVAVESIVYVTEVDDCSGQFKLAVNFPPIYEILMTELTERTTKSSVSSPIIDGFRFEKYVCSQLRVLDLCITDESGSTHVCSLPIELNVSQSHTCIMNLSIGTLYHLRCGHPVIDAVGVLKDRHGSHYLVMLQVSLLAYRKHRSKAENLKDTVVSPESLRKPDVKFNWIDYYTELAHTSITPISHATSADTARDRSIQNVKRVYVYVSPEQLLDNKSDETPRTILEEVGINNRTQDFCLGLVQANTSTSRDIERFMCNLHSDI